MNELPKLTHLILRENPIAYVPHYREHVLFHLCNGTLETAVVVLDAREWTKSEWHAIRSRSCSTLVAQREWRQNRVCLSKNVVQFSSSDSVELTRVCVRNLKIDLWLHSNRTSIKSIRNLSGLI